MSARRTGRRHRCARRVAHRRRPRRPRPGGRRGRRLRAARRARRARRVRAVRRPARRRRRRREVGWAYRQVLADLTGRAVVVPRADEQVAAGACVQAAAVLTGADPTDVADAWELGRGRRRRARPGGECRGRRARRLRGTAGRHPLTRLDRRTGGRTIHRRRARGTRRGSRPGPTSMIYVPAGWPAKPPRRSQWRRLPRQADRGGSEATPGGRAPAELLLGRPALRP